MTTYRITTLDLNTGDYTPQVGCPFVVTGFRGLLFAARRLRALGFESDRRDHNVQVETIGENQ